METAWSTAPSANFDDKGSDTVSCTSSEIASDAARYSELDDDLNSVPYEGQEAGEDVRNDKDDKEDGISKKVEKNGSLGKEAEHGSIGNDEEDGSQEKDEEDGSYGKDQEDGSQGKDEEDGNHGNDQVGGSKRKKDDIHSVKEDLGQIGEENGVRKGKDGDDYDKSEEDDGCETEEAKIYTADLKASYVYSKQSSSSQSLKDHHYTSKVPETPTKGKLRKKIKRLQDKIRYREKKSEILKV